jgi:hypothetical protein
MPSAGFEPAIPANERLQTHAFDRAATGIGKNTLYTHGIENISKYKILYSPFSQYVASMTGWIVNEQLERIWKKAVTV